MSQVNARSDFYPEQDQFAEEDTQKDKFLTFRLASEDYGISIRQVTEIIGIQTITEIPDMPAFIKGVINLRGKVVPVMDVRSRFGLPQREYDQRTCVVVVDVAGKAMGLIVDHVNEVLDIPAQQVEPPPAGHGEGGRRFVRGMGKIGEKVKILLDVEALFV
ncbi:MAG: chemotaxis protein CheW [Syntrophotaleaceae bacterium]